MPKTLPSPKPMPSNIVRKLNDMNRAFYARVADEFDATRDGAWQGWYGIKTYIPLTSGESHPFARVLDVGCGNGRFGVFIAKENPNGYINYFGIDSSRELLTHAEKTLAVIPHPNFGYSLEKRDFIEQPLDEKHDFPYRFHLVVAFGVLHHIPGTAQRMDFVRSLANLVLPDGHLVYTEWRFYEDQRFHKHLLPPPADLAPHLEKGDYFLDWGGDKTAMRYCHYVDDAEHKALIAATGLTLAQTYRADGYNRDTNMYVVLHKP